MEFYGQNHKDFYFDALKICRRDDSYHRAFFYLMGLTPETRNNIQTVFDFDEDMIKPEGLTAGWQTGTTDRICRLAFNLWNGYCEKDSADLYTPDWLFSVPLGKWLMYAIMLRYPDNFR